MVNKIKKQTNETRDQYFYRLCREKDALDLTWEQLKDIFNNELGNNYGESAYRKEWNAFQRIFHANEDKLVDGVSYLYDIKEAKRELEKERKKLQTEKVEYNKWLRENARDEMIRDSIIEEIRNCEPMTPPIRTFDLLKEGNKSACLCIADSHYGVEFEIPGLHGEILNKYSPEIFEQRMEILFNKVVDIIMKEHVNTLYIFSLGDEVEGILRVSQLMKLRYGVVKQSVRYAKYIASWINELTKYVDIKFYSCSGNHSELRMIGQPKGSFKDDNTVLWINEIIQTSLENNQCFEFIENPTGLIFDNIQGYNVLGIHGECKDLSKAIKDFSNTYNTNIDILVGGHMHHSKEENVGLYKDVISVPSIIGIDDFSMKLNRTSNPGATLFFIEKDLGKVLEYNIKL